jgi:hypothetical protein
MNTSSLYPEPLRGDAFALDVSTFPHVSIALRGSLGLTEAQLVTSTLKAKVFDRAQPYTLLVDATHANVPDAAARQHFAEFSKANSPITKRFCRGEAYILPSAVLRGALTAIMWFSPFEYPHKVFASVDEARAWVAQVAV